MASIYPRKDSPFIWIRYKDSSGKWKSTDTGYRWDNIGDRKQACLLAKKKSLEEMANKPARVASQKWEDWVLPWINSRWGDRTNRTPAKANLDNVQRSAEPSPPMVSLNT